MEPGSPIRTLFVTPAYPPFPGGGERYVRSLAQTLQAAGHQITVLTSTARTEQDLWQPTPLETAVEQDGPIEVIRRPLRGVFGGRRGLLAWRKAMVLLSALPGDQTAVLQKMAQMVPPLDRLTATLNEMPDHFDLIQAFNISWEGPLVAAWHLARRRNRPLVVTPFAHLGHAGRDRVARNSTMDHQRCILAEAGAILALTSVEREGLGHFGIDTAKISVVGSGLDPLPTAADTGQTLAKYALQPPYILSVGRVSYDKGAVHTAEAVLRLAEAGVETTAVFVGQVAPEFERFYRALTPRQQTLIHPLGILDEAEKHALLSAAAVLALPSRTDSFGIVILEAWAYGKPVVGARVGGIRGVIDHEENGLLVDFGDVTGLAAAFRRLLDEAALSRQLGLAGQTKIEQRYTWERVAEQVAGVWQGLIAV